MNQLTKGSISGTMKAMKVGANMTQEGHQETDVDREFLEKTDLADMDRTYLDSAVEKFDETQFDAFTCYQILGIHSLQYVTFKIFQMYNFFNSYHISLEKLVNFS